MKNTRTTRLQQGVTITGLIIVLVIMIFAGLLAFKVLPPYMEFRTMKNAIQAIARDRQSASVADIRRAYESRQAIDDFTSVKAADLDISKQGSQVIIAFAYRKEIPLFGSVGLYIDFAANSQD
jgi:Tfp pilus assembly protein FimT